MGEMILATLLPCTTLSLYTVNASERYNAVSSFIGLWHAREKAKAEAKAQKEAKAEEEEKIFIGW